MGYTLKLSMGQCVWLLWGMVLLLGCRSRSVAVSVFLEASHLDQTCSLLFNLKTVLGEHPFICCDEKLESARELSFQEGAFFSFLNYLDAMKRCHFPFKRDVWTTSCPPQFLLALYPEEH